MKTFEKKFLAFVLCLVMAFGLCACGKNNAMADNQTESIDKMNGAIEWRIHDEWTVVEKENSTYYAKTGYGKVRVVHLITLENEDYKIIIRSDDTTYLRVNIGDVIVGTYGRHNQTDNYHYHYYDEFLIDGYEYVFRCVGCLEK